LGHQSVATPNVAHGKECPAAAMDWMTMSLAARNLAYNNGEHVGLEYARTKTESWIAASKALREQRAKHLDLAYAPGERTSGTSIPPTTLTHRASFTFMVAIGSATAGKSLPVLQKVHWPAAGRLHCPDIRSPRRRV
jgi:hypothetical protein